MVALKRLFLQVLNDRMKELENHRVALATAKSQYEQAKDGLQRAKETEVSAEMILTPQLYNFLLRE